MIDESLAQQLRLKGAVDHLHFSTINTSDVKESGVMVEFKIRAMDDDSDPIDVKDAWSIKDLNIPFKHQVHA